MIFARNMHTYSQSANSICMFFRKAAWIELEAKAFFCVYVIAILSIGTGAVLLDELFSREELVFVDFQFIEREDYIFFQVRNVGTTDILIEEVLLNSQPHFRFIEYPFRIRVGETEGLVCEHEWKSELCYVITLVTKTGKIFSTFEAAPQRYLPLEVEAVTWNSTDDTITLAVGNTDKREQNISHLGMSESPNDPYRWIESDEISSTNLYLVNSGWDWRISVPAGQVTTIVLDWPYHDPWVNGTTYFFRIYTEFGPSVYFDSIAP